MNFLIGRSTETLMLSKHIGCTFGLFTPKKERRSMAKPREHKDLENFFTYDTNTGTIIAARARQRVKLGSSPGYVGARGATVIGVGGRKWLAHRFVHYLVTADVAPRPVVAIDGDYTNLRWSNLHKVTADELDAFYAYLAARARAARLIAAGGQLPSPPRYVQTEAEIEAGVNFNKGTK